jgi:hypothetical protein
MKTYKIEAYGYGGELAIGECNPAFVEYWNDIVNAEGDSDLVDSLYNMGEYEHDPEDALIDPETPPLPFIEDDFKPYFEFDELEHRTSVFSDGKFKVVEIDPETGEETGNFDEEFEFNDFRVLASREAYLTDCGESPEPDNENFVPVLSCFGSEKGLFWTATFETEEFNPDLLAFTLLESNLAELIDGVFYNFKELEMDHDELSTTGKGLSVTVGWMNKDWHDKEIGYIDEALADWKEELESEE